MNNGLFIFGARRLLSEPTGERQSEALNGQIELDGTSANVTGEARLTNIDDGILAELAFTATFPLECARCLKQYSQTLQIEATEVFADKLESPSEIEEQFTISPTFQIDLSEPIRQAIILSIPSFPLCQTTCKGILEETNES